MMPQARLVDDLDLAAQLAVTCFDAGRVLGHGHDVVGIADDVDQRDLALAKGSSTSTGLPP